MQENINWEKMDMARNKILEIDILYYIYIFSRITRPWLCIYYLFTYLFWSCLIFIKYYKYKDLEMEVNKTRRKK